MEEKLPPPPDNVSMVSGLAQADPADCERDSASPVARHTFNVNAERWAAEAAAISAQRGGEYQDSWALYNQHTPFTDQLWRFAQKHESGPPSHWSRPFKRLNILSALIDVKLSRLIGEPKDDTFLDITNYLNAYASLFRDYRENWTVERATIAKAAEIVSAFNAGVAVKSPARRPTPSKRRPAPKKPTPKKRVRR